MQERMFWNIQIGVLLCMLFNPRQYLLLLLVRGGDTIYQSFWMKNNSFLHNVYLGDAS